MLFFNLMEYKLQKESMANPYGGSIHYKNREPLKWWNYEDLSTSSKVAGKAPISLDEDQNTTEDPIDQWVIWANRDNSLNRLLRDAGIYRRRYLRKIHKEYGMSLEQANRMMKTFVGYHPSYGGTICQIGPYVSEGGGHGAEHIRHEGKTKFAPFVLPRKRTTLDDIQNALAHNISDYTKSFGIEFKPEDFGLEVMSPASESTSSVIEEHIDDLREDNPALQDFGRRAPMIGVGSRINFNNRGWEKILTNLLGTWYQPILEAQARRENKTIEQVASETLADTNILKEVYDKVRKKWEEARDRGEATAIGMPEPPKFNDRKRGTFGAQIFSALKPNNRLLSDQQELKLEIINMMKEGLSDPQIMADRLNADPKRKAANSRRRYKGLELSIISTDEVNRHISTINHEMYEQNIDINQVYDDAIAFKEKMLSTAGYDDLKTAFDVASIHWSAGTADPITRTKMGTSNAIAFIPSDDFHNYTSDELKEMKEAEEDRKAIEKGEEPPVRTQRVVSPEQLQRDIGRRMPEPEKTPVENAPTPSVPAHDLGDFGDFSDLGDFKEEEKIITPTPRPKSKQVKEKIKKPKPVPVTTIDDEEYDVMGSTIKHLIKVAEELDSENKLEEAEEVHKVIRKYVEKL